MRIKPVRKIPKKLFGHFPGSAQHESRADLGEVAADLKIGAVSKLRNSISFVEANVVSATPETGRSSFAAAASGIALSRLHVFQREAGIEFRPDRADCRYYLRGKFGVTDLFQRLATRNTFSEHFRIDQCSPNLLAAARDLIFAFDFHLNLRPKRGVRPLFPDPTG